MTFELSKDDQSMLEGGHGHAAAAAMKILVAFSKAVGTESLLDISGAHTDGFGSNDLTPARFER